MCNYFAQILPCVVLINHMWCIQMFVLVSIAVHIISHQVIFRCTSCFFLNCDEICGAAVGVIVNDEAS